jgi:hypothetical protein
MRPHSCGEARLSKSYAPPAGVPWPLAVALRKFVLLSFFTMGLYNVYWFYWNWRRQRDATRADIRAGWRTFLSPFTAWLLFRDVRALAQRTPRWNPAALGVAYFLLLLAFLAPHWLWLLTWLSFLPLVPVQRTINGLYRERRHAVDAHISARDVLLMLIGAVVMALLIALAIAVDRGVFSDLLSTGLSPTGLPLQVPLR